MGANSVYGYTYSGATGKWTNDVTGKVVGAKPAPSIEPSLKSTAPTKSVSVPTTTINTVKNVSTPKVSTGGTSQTSAPVSVVNSSAGTHNNYFGLGSPEAYADAIKTKLTQGGWSALSNPTAAKAFMQSNQGLFSEAPVRQQLVSMGIPDSSIGYDMNTGSVTVNGTPIMQPSYILNSTAYANPEEIRQAVANSGIMAPVQQYQDLLAQYLEKLNYNDQYAGQINDIINKIQNYEDPYLAQANEALGYVYNPTTDPGLQAALDEAVNRTTEVLNNQGILSSDISRDTIAKAVASTIPQFQQLGYAQNQNLLTDLLGLSNASYGRETDALSALTGLSESAFGRNQNILQDLMNAAGAYQAIDTSNYQREQDALANYMSMLQETNQQDLATRQLDQQQMAELLPYILGMTPSEQANLDLNQAQLANQQYMGLLPYQQPTVGESINQQNVMLDFLASLMGTTSKGTKTTEQNNKNWQTDAKTYLTGRDISDVLPEELVTEYESAISVITNPSQLADINYSFIKRYVNDAKAANWPLTQIQSALKAFGLQMHHFNDVLNGYRGYTPGAKLTDLDSKYTASKTPANWAYSHSKG